MRDAEQSSTAVGGELFDRRPSETTKPRCSSSTGNLLRPNLERLPMWTWLQHNSGAVSAVFDFLTLVVWTFYLQVFLTSFRHTTKPKILINRGAGHGLDSKCAVTNMSAEAIYVEAVILSLRVAKEDGPAATIECSLSDLDSDGTYTRDPRPLWFQGPLRSGEMIDIGSYRSLLERALRSQALGPDGGVCSVEEMTVTIAATYIADDRTIGAQRGFRIEGAADRLVLVPRRFSTHQIRSGQAVRSLHRLLKRLEDRDSDPFPDRTS